ncbi:MAG: hypothetical protein ABI456_12015 [Ktedonobacteraceae bacterium]
MPGAGLATIFARYIRENPEKLSNPKELFWNDASGYWIDLESGRCWNSPDFGGSEKRNMLY